jgi:hypothetical protein
MEKQTILAHQLSAENIKTFFYAGRATVTLKNSNTGNRFTYRVTTPQDHDGNPPYFVKLMTGPDNETSFTFIGTIFDKKTYRHSAKSKISINTISSRLMGAFVEFLAAGKTPKGLEVWHEGRCGKCGRKLTVPESIQNGLGPECAKNMK